jgi:hypothetical protein
VDELNQALLDAHVAHVLARFEGEAFDGLVRAHVTGLFEWFDQVRFGEVITLPQVLGSVDRFVIDLRVSGGITELAGDMARVVIASDASEGVRLSDILPTSSYAEFADKLQRFDRLREDLIGLVLRSQAFSEAGARLLSQRVAQVLAKRLSRLEDVPLMGFAAKLEERMVPRLEKRLRSVFFQRFEQYRERMAEELAKSLISALDADFVRSLLDDIWAGMSGTPLVEVFALLGERDLEDLVVTVLEFWLRFRKSRYLREVIAAGVAFFFEKYGNESVASVIDDMGVTCAMVTDEILNYGKPIVAHAVTSGFFERVLRAELGGFYASPACAALLAGVR